MGSGSYGLQVYSGQVQNGFESDTGYGALMTTMTPIALNILDKLISSNSYEDNSTGQPSSKTPRSISTHIKNAKEINHHIRRQQVCCNPSRSLIKSEIL